MTNKDSNIIRVNFSKSDGDGPQRRKFHREKCLIKAQLVYDAQWQQTIFLEDISDGGACLRASSPDQLPETFDVLGFMQNQPLKCRKIWVAPGKTGVEFLYKNR